MTMLAMVFLASCTLFFTRISVAQTTSPGGQTADIPRVISYQGLLKNSSGQPLPDGLHLITIRFYSDAEGGSPVLWEDVFKVPTNAGVFSILLGSQKPLPDASTMGQPLWVGVTVDSTDLRPLSQLTSSPYAMSVANSSITTEKMGTDYVGAISVNGTKVTSKGSNINLKAGSGLDLSFDTATSAILLSLAGTGTSLGSGMKTLSVNPYINNQTTVESGANFNIDGSGTIGSTLTVGGTSNLNGNVSISGSHTLSVGGTMSVGGNSTIGGNETMGVTHQLAALHPLEEIPRLLETLRSAEIPPSVEMTRSVEISPSEAPQRQTSLMRMELQQ